MKRVGIGGQAVLEGIMMKGPDKYSLAVRKEDGEIALEVHSYQSFGERKHLDRIPIVRGVVNFVESLYIGMKTLMASSEYFMEEDEEDENTDGKKSPAEKKPEVTGTVESESGASESVTFESVAFESGTSESVTFESVTSESGTSESGTSGSGTLDAGVSDVKTKETGAKKEAVSEGTSSEAKDKDKDRDKEKDKEKSDSKGFLIVTLVISLAFAIGVFVLLPSFLANFLYKVTDSHILVNTCEGLLRMAIFLGYVAIISNMKDIKRTFMYHGAEHKAINCLEAGDDLTPENVLKHTRFHKRCGTSFVFIVMIISIFVFMFVRTDTVWLRLLSRLLLIPVIAGLSYEVIRYAGRHNNACSRILSAPGLWVQRLTTREPDITMAEVAVKAVDAVIDIEEYVNCVRNDSFEK